jgi:rhamnosyltransferase
LNGDPRASVLIRTWNGGERLRRVVERVREQRGVDFEVVLLDSGSTDGAPAALAGGPVRCVPYTAPFTHPGSSNAVAREARGELLVFLSQDALPRDNQWLVRLEGALADPGVAAAFCRQVPDASTPVLEARDLRRAYPPAGDSPVALSNAASALRRSLWREHPFDERLPLAEDLEWALWARSRGHRVRYIPESVVEHAHHLDLAAVRARFRAEGRALAQLGRPPLPGTSPGPAGLRGLPGDLGSVLRAGRWGELGLAWRYHLEMFRALAQGASEAGAQAAPGVRA